MPTRFLVPCSASVTYLRFVISSWAALGLRVGAIFDFQPCPAAGAASRTGNVCLARTSSYFLLAVLEQVMNGSLECLRLLRPQPRGMLIKGNPESMLFTWPGVTSPPAGSLRGRAGDSPHVKSFNLLVTRSLFRGFC